MVRTIMQRYSDNVARVAALSVSVGSVAAGYDLAWLVDDDPARPCIFNEVTVAILFDWGTARRQDSIALIHANLATGLSVQYQCNAADSWGSPTVNASIAIPAYRENRYPTNAYKDLTGVAGYSTSGFRYGRLVITGNPVLVSLGEVVVCSQKREIEWLDNKQKFADERKLIEHSTDVGVTSVFDLGVNVRRFEGTVTNRVPQRELLTSHWADSNGRVYPFLFIPNSLNGEPWLVRWADPVKEDSFVTTGVSTLSCKFTELSRGLYPTPSAV